MVKSLNGIILPNNGLKNKWDIYVMFLLLYTALFVPYRVCFEDSTSSAMQVFDYMMDISFAIDIILTFFSAYESNGTVVVNKKKIAIKYLKGWFCLDVLTTFPFQMLEPGDSVSNNKALRLARIPRLYRLLRIFRLLKVLKVMKLG